MDVGVASGGGVAWAWLMDDEWVWLVEEAWRRRGVGVANGGYVGVGVAS